MSDGCYEELQEDDVWDIVNQKETDGGSPRKAVMRKRRDNNIFLPTPASSSSRVIPRAAGTGGGSSSNLNNQESSKQSSSDPVNIPDWSKIYRRRSSKRGSSSSYVSWDFDENKDWGDEWVFGGNKNDVENDEDGGEVLPPHEYIAMKLSRAQIASSSMCEGVGRTLKGRDLSKLRNAILSKTGFLE